jgi:hypothetical protein
VHVERGTVASAFEKLAALYQDVGLRDRREFLLPPDDGKERNEFRAGLKWSRTFESVNVGECRSRECGGAYKFGDGELSERIVRKNANAITHPPSNQLH